MQKPKTFNDFWNNINYSNAPVLKKHFKQLKDKLVEQLLLGLIDQEEFEIGISHQGRKKWAMISYDQWETEKELWLRLDTKNQFDLYFGYCDADGNRQEIIEPLSENEIALIPAGLVSLMKQVITTSKTTSVNKNTINLSN